MPQSWGASLWLHGQLVAPNERWVHRVMFWITYPLGLVSYLWLGLMLVDAAAAIGKHLDGESKTMIPQTGGSV